MGTPVYHYRLAYFTYYIVEVSGTFSNDYLCSDKISNCLLEGIKMLTAGRVKTERRLPHCAYVHFDLPYHRSVVFLVIKTYGVQPYSHIPCCCTNYSSMYLILLWHFA